MANKIVFGSPEYKLFKERTADQERLIKTPLPSASLSSAADSSPACSNSTTVPSGSTSTSGSVSSQSTTSDLPTPCSNARESLKRKAETEPNNSTGTSTMKPKKLKCSDSNAFFAVSRKLPTKRIEYLNTTGNGFEVHSTRTVAPTLRKATWTDTMKKRFYTHRYRVVEERPATLFLACAGSDVLRPSFISEDVVLAGDRFDKPRGRIPLHERGHCTGQVKVAGRLPGISMAEAVEASKRRRRD